MTLRDTIPPIDRLVPSASALAEDHNRTNVPIDPYDEPVGHHPVEPTARHVWVKASGNHGPPTAGVVVAWQHAPVHNAHADSWLALVVTTPFDDALAMSWVGAERLIELQDPSAADDPT